MNVTQLFTNVSSDAKGRAIAPTEGSNEWNQWLSWLNEEYQTNAEVHDWPEYRKLSFQATGAQSGTSVALPSNFKKLAGSPIINGEFYKEVDSDQFDKYGFGNQVVRTGYDNGYFMQWNGGLAEDTSITVPIVHYPTALASPTDNVVFRNPTYLIKRLKVRIFKYRQDPIFTEIESEADLMLQQLLENEYYKHSQYESGATTREEETGFTLGLD
jgi:hypothetical protein